MKIVAPVSLGELVDKITILEIKRSQLPAGDKLKNVEREAAVLWRVFGFSLDADQLEEIQPLIKKLAAVNLRLWDIEDLLRAKEKIKDFGPAFVQAARSVYKTNDERARIKHDINTRFGSELVEEKAYA